MKHLKNRINAFVLDRRADATLDWILGIVLAIALISIAVRLAGTSYESIWNSLVARIEGIIAG